MAEYTQPEREQAARVLEGHSIQISDNRRGYCIKIRGKDFTEMSNALDTAIACLRSPIASPETDGKAGGWDEKGRGSMTRDEAIKTLKDRIEQYTGGVHPGEREILLEAFSVLRPTPDPATGLMPCGCGGKVIIKNAHDDTQTYVVCEGCNIGTPWYRNKLDAVAAWNLSHGFPEVK